MEFLMLPMEPLLQMLAADQVNYLCCCGHNIYQCGCNSVVGCGCPPIVITDP